MAKLLNDLIKKIPNKVEIQNLLMENINHPKVKQKREQIEQSLKNIGEQSMQNPQINSYLSLALNHKITEQALSNLTVRFPNTKIVKKLEVYREDLLRELKNSTTPEEPIKNETTTQKEVPPEKPKKSVVKAKAKRRTSDALKMAAEEAGVFKPETSTQDNSTLDSEESES